MNKTTDVAIYDANGKLIHVLTQVDKIDISHLTKGIYYIKSSENESKKLIVQ